MPHDGMRGHRDVAVPGAEVLARGLRVAANYRLLSTDAAPLDGLSIGNGTRLGTVHRPRHRWKMKQYGAGIAAGCGRAGGTALRALGRGTCLPSCRSAIAAVEVAPAIILSVSGLHLPLVDVGHITGLLADGITPRCRRAVHDPAVGAQAITAAAAGGSVTVPTNRASIMHRTGIVTINISMSEGRAPAPRSHRHSPAVASQSPNSAGGLGDVGRRAVLWLTRCGSMARPRQAAAMGAAAVAASVLPAAASTGL